MIELKKLASKVIALYDGLTTRDQTELSAMLGDFGDKNASSVSFVTRNYEYFRLMTAVPTEAHKKTLAKHGIKYNTMKTKSYPSCLAGYKIVSDLTGSDPGWQSNGYILTKKGKRYYAVSAETSDIFDFQGEEVDSLNKMINGFSRFVDIVKHLHSNGATLPLVDAFVCFHVQGYNGFVVFEAPPTTMTWPEYVQKHLGGETNRKKALKIQQELADKIAPAVKRKMTRIHELGVVFSFNGYRWLDTSTIVVELDDNGGVVNVHPLNYVSSVRANSIMQRAYENDFDIMDRVVRSWSEARDVHRLKLGVVTKQLFDAKVLK
jgi:hypothetical protein